VFSGADGVSVAPRTEGNATTDGFADRPSHV
jgi:hypothetical protein